MLVVGEVHAVVVDKDVDDFEVFGMEFDGFGSDVAFDDNATEAGALFRVKVEAEGVLFGFEIVEEAFNHGLSITRLSGGAGSKVALLWHCLLPVAARRGRCR